MAKKAAATTEEMVQAVREHAIKRYEDGWDTLVECWSDDDIVQELGNARTKNGAIAKCWSVLRVQNAYAKDIQNA